MFNGWKSNVQGLYDYICDYGVREWGAQRAQLILMLPVFVALGIGVYFALPVEPPVFVGAVAFFLAATIFFFLRRTGVRVLLFGLVMVALGFAAAQFRTHFVYTPMLGQEMSYADVEGDIAGIERLEKGYRILLRDVWIEDLSAADTPRMVRVKVWELGKAGRIGARVRLLAGLNPPSPPVMPGGFDFQRHMYFKGIGALGFAYRTPEVVADSSQDGAFSFHAQIEGLRVRIGDVIQNALVPPRSGIAAALMIGERTSIDDDDMDAIRAAGLAHMLAISGLHVGLFSGVVFFALRLLMAGFPAFALRYPIKKYAAIGALCGAFFYMLLAGATIPTQRAMLTVLVVFGAMLLDRSAISLRVVAFAAFVILLFFPESLMSASFQMSFSAVVGLVAFYDWIRPVWSRWHRGKGFLRRAGLYLAGVSITTVIATVATSPFALFHFHQLASYGLLANLICVPILAFVVMPSAVLAFLLMPFGLEDFAFMLMQPGLDVILYLAHWVAGLDGAVIHVPLWGFLALLMGVFFGLSMILLRGHLRVILCCVCAVLFFLNINVKRYDALISLEFDLVALRGDEPYLLVSNKAKARFERENWERAMGFEMGSAQAFPREGAFFDERLRLRCDAQACRFHIDDIKGSYLRSEDPNVLRDECDWGDVVFSKHARREGCVGARLFNKYDVYDYGAHGLRVEGGELFVERAHDFRGQRLWTQ